MSLSTPTRANRGGYASQKERRRYGASPRSRNSYGFGEEDAPLLPGQFGLLIDENLRPKLVRFARRRGFPAVHVNEVNLRTVEDKHIARYATGNGMVLVTNNVGDFRRLYARRILHPGLIFMQCAAEMTFTELNQTTLLAVALDEILKSDLIQEALFSISSKSPARVSIGS